MHIRHPDLDRLHPLSPQALAMLPQLARHAVTFRRLDDTCVVKLLLGRQCTTITGRIWQSRHRHI